MPEGEGCDDSDTLSLLLQIADFGKTKHIKDLFSSFRNYLRAAEAELPHGARPSLFKPKVTTDLGNRNRSIVANLRQQSLNEIRERTGRMAGWEMASLNLIQKGQGDIDATDVKGAGAPRIFWINSRLKWHEAIEAPLILRWGNKVCYVFGVLGRNYAETSAKTKGKNRLQYTPWKPEHTSKLKVMEAMEIHDKASGKMGFHFCPSSATHLITLNKSTRADLVQLEVDTRNVDENGMALTLTLDALLALHEARAKNAEEDVHGFAKKVDAASKLKFDELALKAEPIKFIEDFKFFPEAFMSPPTSVKGAAEARSGLKYIASLRCQQLHVAMEDVPEDIMLVWPGYCHRAFYQKGIGDKVPLHAYRTDVVFYCEKKKNVLLLGAKISWEFDSRHLRRSLTPSCAFAKKKMSWEFDSSIF